MRPTFELAAGLLPSVLKDHLWDFGGGRCAVSYLLDIAGVDWLNLTPIINSDTACVMVAEIYKAPKWSISLLMALNDHASPSRRVEAVRHRLLKLSQDYDPKVELNSAELSSVEISSIGEPLTREAVLV